MQPKILKQGNSLALSRFNVFDEGIVEVLEALYKGVFFQRRYPMSSLKTSCTRHWMSVCRHRQDERHISQLPPFHRRRRSDWLN